MTTKITVLALLLCSTKYTASSARWEPEKCNCPCDSIANKVKGSDGLWYATVDQVPPSGKIEKVDGKYVGYAFGKCGEEGMFCHKQTCPLSLPPSMASRGVGESEGCSNWAVASLGNGATQQRKPSSAVSKIITNYPWASNSLIFDDGSSWWTGQFGRKKAGTRRESGLGLGTSLSETHPVVNEWFATLCNSRVLISCTPSPLQAASKDSCAQDLAYEYAWGEWFEHAEGCGKEMRREYRMCSARCGCPCTPGSKRALKSETRNRFAVCKSAGSEEGKGESHDCSKDAAPGVDVFYPETYLKEHKHEESLRRELRITSAADNLSDLDLQRLCRHYDLYILSTPTFLYTRQPKGDEGPAAEDHSTRNIDHQKQQQSNDDAFDTKWCDDDDDEEGKGGGGEDERSTNGRGVNIGFAELLGLVALLAVSFVLPDRPHLHLLGGGVLIVVSLALLAERFYFTLFFTLVVEMAVVVVVVFLSASAGILK